MSTVCLSTNHCQCSLCCILTPAFPKQPNKADLSTGGMKRMVTSKYHSVNVLVSRPTLCVLLKKYMLLTHDRICLFTADKCKTLLEVSYFDSVLYFCFNSFPVYAICLDWEWSGRGDSGIWKKGGEEVRERRTNRNKCLNRSCDIEHFTTAQRK